jgi:ribosome-binding factor A
MAREFGRSARVASQLQKELALVLQQNIKDPRLGFVTVNDIEVTRDLAVAKVYISVLQVDEQGKRDNIRHLNKAAHYIRNEVGKRMRLRSVPELRFYYDDSFDTGMRIAELLKDKRKPDPDPEEE